MHRNTYINAPKVLNEGFQLKSNKNLFIAGQMSGVEGYVESIMSGMIAALNLDRTIKGQDLLIFPKESIIGALQRHLVDSTQDYQPMNANFGILPELQNPPRDKKERKQAYTTRSLDLIDKMSL